VARTRDDEKLIAAEERLTLAFYDMHAARYALRTEQADLGQLYDRFLPLLPVGGRILDVGCGGGRDLRAFKALGFDCFGVDPSERLAMIAAEFSACEVLVARVQDLRFVEEFDGVWACASLLHLPRSELPLAIARIREALRVNGILFLSMQEGAGESVAADGRFYARYSLNELRAIALSADLDVITQWSTKDTLAGRGTMSWLNLLVRKPAAGESLMTSPARSAFSPHE
jgi:SAM-dependent methyltransferase